jgi:uncharacterized protein YdeI (YjbR/CyaY-like superfamily)
MEKKKDFSGLSRPIQPMPDYVKAALEKTGLLKTYLERPPYQQNDYLSWISRARRPETKEKRLAQMLFELDHGGLYMKMKHNPSRNK